MRNTLTYTGRLGRARPTVGFFPSCPAPCSLTTTTSATIGTPRAAGNKTWSRPVGGTNTLLRALAHTWVYQRLGNLCSNERTPDPLWPRMLHSPMIRSRIIRALPMLITRWCAPARPGQARLAPRHRQSAGWLLLQLRLDWIPPTVRAQRLRR